MGASENPYQTPVTPIALTKSAREASARKRGWLVAYSMAIGSVYGPYVVMTLYTQFFVDCDHCRHATRNMLAFAPGLLPVDLAQRALGISRQGDWIWFSASMFFTLIWVTGLAWLIRRIFWFGVPAATISFGISCWLAYVLLALIQM